MRWQNTKLEAGLFDNENDGKIVIKNDQQETLKQHASASDMEMRQD